MDGRSGSVSTFENFLIADLFGTWREMGRQYGQLLSARLKAAYEFAVEEHIIGAGLMTRDEAEERAFGFFANFPYRFSEYLHGMADASGLTVQQHVLLNAVEILAESAKLGCTCMSVWGEYTESNLICAKNLDAPEWMRGIYDRAVVTVMHPADGSLSIASISPPGTICMAAGINEHGILVTMNDGSPSGGALHYHNRVPVGAMLLQHLLDSPDLEQLESSIFTTRADRAAIVCAADERTSRCYEWPVFDVKRRLSVRRPGLIVATNHFTEPSWGLPRPRDEKFRATRTRRQDLLNLAEHFKGSIDMTRMKKIMDTKIDDLGATTEQTAFQIIAVPGTVSLSVKVPGRTDWVDIRIGDFLNSRRAE